MSSFLRITVRFLQPLAHGRTDGGEPEWPPSPLRVFQALVAAAAARWNERTALAYARPALGWLEGRPPPEIVAPAGTPSQSPYRLYVPDNVGDLVAKAWAAGRDADLSAYRTEKDVRPTHLAGDAVHYLYPLPEPAAEFAPHVEVLTAAARSVTHLGWGVDMVAATADVISDDDAAQLPGHRWRVVPAGGVPLRVPTAGTLTNLMEKHKAFLGRLSNDGFKPVPPLRTFAVVRYHSPTAGPPGPGRPVIAFEIHRTIEDQEREPGKSRFRPFHHVHRVATVAGMVRHATAAAARQLGWDEADVTRRVEGHGGGKDGQATTDDRLMFLPLPSVTPNGVAGIRRVLVVGPPGFDLAPLRRHLNGRELTDEPTGQPVAALAGLAGTDGFLRQNYLGEAATWSTVTPVILPGHDDPDGLRRRLATRVTADEQKHLLARLDARILALLGRAFRQAGWTADALAGAELAYRPVGWFRGLDLARNYDLPPLRYPRFHVRVTFPRPVRGPLAIGAGRYRGFGLLAIDR